MSFEPLFVLEFLTKGCNLAVYCCLLCCPVGGRIIVAAVAVSPTFVVLLPKRFGFAVTGVGPVADPISLLGRACLSKEMD